MLKSVNFGATEEGLSFGVPVYIGTINRRRVKKYTCLQITPVRSNANIPSISKPVPSETVLHTWKREHAGHMSAAYSTQPAAIEG